MPNNNQERLYLSPSAIQQPPIQTQQEIQYSQHINNASNRILSELTITELVFLMLLLCSILGNIFTIRTLINHYKSMMITMQGRRKGEG